MLTDTAKMNVGKQDRCCAHHDVVLVEHHQSIKLQAGDICLGSPLCSLVSACIVHDKEAQSAEQVKPREVINMVRHLEGER